MHPPSYCHKCPPWLFSRFLLGTLLISCGQTYSVSPAIGQTPSFRTIVLSEEFQSEGADAADINGDGVTDIVSGPFWYEGPEFRQRHRYMPGKRHPIVGYSDHFFTWCIDLNGDTFPDVITIGMPGQPAWWHENPGKAVKDVSGEKTWSRHKVMDDVAGESPALVDFDGDGRLDLVCIHGGRFGVAHSSPKAPHDRWTFKPISTADNLGVFTHGMGVGDVDADGQLDLMETRGWWRRSQTSPWDFTLMEQRFAQSGGAQMFAEDFDGDGDSDVLSVQNAHGWGLTWFERRGKGDGALFVPHPILSSSQPTAPSSAVAISQMHSVALVDVDGDGWKDIVTGKRFWAHGGKDPGAQEPAALFWFRTQRSDGRVNFVPHLIHARVGVGTQLTAKDVNQDGRVDFVIGNKLGTFVVMQTEDGPPAPTWTPELASIGTDLFRSHIRESEPQDADAQEKSFVLPEGFEIQLVASDPQIAKPLNMAFDARGRLWVTSTVEYPVPATGRRGRDSIKVLEDTDGDGQYDRTTTFAEGLNIPMGLYPVANGVICFDIPNIVLLEDTDSDGVADARTQLYGPFDTTRDTHGMCNAFTRGDDGWLYACHGFNNRSTVAGADGHEITMRSGNVFRMTLDGRRVEHYAMGQVNPFGLTFDRWGDIYTADCHTKPINLVLAGGFHDSFGAPHDGLGYVPNVLDHLHGSTGVGGVALGESLRFPSIYRSSTFGGNVVTGRVNRNSLQRGAAVRAIEEPDFLISSDPWFRPVDIQAGPDGALYIADFYNRIIGHYEVGLDHPGRDRHRGRIWRVVYRGASNRRDAGPSAAENSTTENSLNLQDLSVATLFKQLATSVPEERRRIVNILCDQRLNLAAQEASKHLANSQSNEATMVGCLWILGRHKSLSGPQLDQAIASQSPVVRTHAFRASAFTQQLNLERLEKGLQDRSPTVRRAAAMAAAALPDQGYIGPLMASLRAEASDSGSHVRHAMRMAVRSHLENPSWFKEVVSSVGADDLPDLLTICLALKSEAAGDFVAEQLGKMTYSGHDASVKHAIPRERLYEFATFAARHASQAAAAKLAQTIQAKFKDDINSQLQLIESMDQGIRQRGGASPEVRSWAIQLARQLATSGESMQGKLQWRFAPATRRADDRANRTNCWSVSNSRKCADGVEGAALYSTFPSGEQRTGIYRSAPFALDNMFSFYVAGHDGFPDKPRQNKNFVRLRLAASHHEIQRAKAPRNDVAQHVQWDTSTWNGQMAYLELVDQDTASAYAWIAVGRFSDARLNPSSGQTKRDQAAQLVTRFRLEELRDVMSEQLSDNPHDLGAAAALATLAGGSRMAAMAQCLAIEALQDPARTELVRILSERDQAQIEPALRKSFRMATTAEQQSLATALAADHDGLSLLLSLVETGGANAALLGEKAVRESLDVIGGKSHRERAEKWSASIEAEAPGIAVKIAEMERRFLEQPGVAERGRALYEKNCAVCHQIAGKGKKVGPNLDGIGNRGLSRLLEDVLAPNRNVDIAFRATTVVTKDGQIITGALLPDDGSSSLEIVNARGEPVRVPKSEVARQKRSASSPMPENFASTVTDDELRDLVAFLLSVRQ